jgi:hypothetical protein
MRTFGTLASAAAIAGTLLALPTQAEARWRGGGGAVAAGIIGGIAAGALIAGAARPYGYGPYYGYYAPGYYAPPCYWQRQRFWDGYGWRIRRVQVCY